MLLGVSIGVLTLRSRPSRLLLPPLPLLLPPFPGSTHRRPSLPPAWSRVFRPASQVTRFIGNRFIELSAYVVWCDVL